MEFSQALFGDQLATVQRSFAELQAKTAAHDGLFGLGHADWSVDLLAGTITFTTDRYRATAPVQVIGTYDTQDGSWLWGWDHPSVSEPLAQDAGTVRDWARRHGLTALLERKIVCSEHDAWTFTALATHLASAQGGYRGPAGATLVFMTFGTVSLQSAHTAGT